MHAAFFLVVPMACVLASSVRAANPRGGQSNEVGAVLLQLQIHPFVSRCQQDGEISSEKRAVVENAALLFVRAGLGPDPAAGYPQFTTGAQKETSLEQFVNHMKQAVQPFGPFEPLSVSHTYLLEVTGETEGERVACGTFSRPENWVAVSVKPSTEQAWILIEGKARNNAWTFVAWLLPVAKQWRVVSFYAGVSTFGDKSASEIWSLAHAEAERGHSMNAALLYASALQLTWRGPGFQLGITPNIQDEMQKLQVPAALQGQPPFNWEFGHDSFRVLRVGPIAVAGKIYLLIAHELPRWKDYNEVDQKNRELIKDFAGRFPEFSDVFAGLIAEAHESDGSQGYRTVEEVRNGSLQPGAPPKPND